MRWPILDRAYKERRSEMVLNDDSRIAYDLDKVLEMIGRADRDVTLHLFRHTVAVHMLNNGATVWTVAHVIGNTVAMVERV